MKKISLSLLFIILAGVAGIAIYRAVQYRTVSFTLNGDSSYSVAVENTEGTRVATVESSGSVSLHKGDYFYFVEGTNFDNTKYPFTVGSESSVITVEPLFSRSYLAAQLIEQQVAIKSVLSSTYPALAPAMNFTSLQLYEKGEWAAGVFSYAADPRDIPDNYRFVLKKSDETWRLVVPPQIAINKNNYKDVPVSILNSLYRDDL